MVPIETAEMADLRRAPNAGIRPSGMVQSAPIAMMLTLTATSLASLLRGSRGQPKAMALADLPGYIRQSLGISGLNLSTGMLAGMDRAGLESLRERADKAGCSCILLIESEGQALGDDSQVGDSAEERVTRVLQAAHHLGCNAAAVTVAGEDNAGTLEVCAERLRSVMSVAEQMELNLLISPGPGLTESPERVSELLKRVGGFRIGTFPDFEAAAKWKDPEAYLRRLTPYASVVCASTLGFEALDGGKLGTNVDAPVKHKGYDLQMLVGAVVLVGYDGTMAIDYRGKGDPTLGILRSRACLEEVLAKETGKS